MKKTIRLNNTSSVNSVNVNNSVDVEFKQSTKLLPHMEIIDKVNLYEIFEEERNKSDNYRLIITINPICTNVLFNTLTEIVKFEGEGDKIDKIILVENDTPISVTQAIGDNNPDRYQMIKNTEYSNDKCGFVYHCGYDIFNNHILRNTSFKQVNTLLSGDKNKTDSNQTGSPIFSKIFNTIGDVMRYSDGTIVKYNKRKNVSTTPTMGLNKHLYEYSDILAITDSINQNLIEEKGWFGFTNGMNINSKQYTGSNGNIWGDPLDVNKVINRQKACEFIDMYPDRSLFSFNPKVNKKEKRLEYNWKMCLTYPYDTTYNHLLVYGDGINGLDCYSCVRSSGLSGDDVLVFRTTCKHGLKPTDSVMLYATTPNGQTIKIPDALIVKDTGNLDKKYRDNYFYVLNYDILNHIFGDDWQFNFTQEKLNDINFRIRHLVGDFESEYYIRLFKKLPNFKYSKKEFTEEIGSNREKFDKFVEENATFCNKDVVGKCPDDNLFMLDFNYELYQLAFASTIYSDKSSQLTFTDTLDISNIKDKSGKPITEIFLTVVKNNVGWDKWYLNDTQRNDKSVEFSHCFGKITSGFPILNIKQDKSSSIKNKDDIRFSDVHKLHNLASSYPIVSSIPLEIDISISGSTKWYSGNAEHDVFWGDLVEFNKSQVQEIVLEKVCHRFNTIQRELDEQYFKNGGNVSTYNKWKTFKFDEIEADDYDNSLFTIKNEKITDYNGLPSNQRPEGYYYEAHYPIMLKELSSRIQQDALITFTVAKDGVNPDNYSNNPNYAKIKVNVKHKLKEGDYIRVTNTNDKSYSLGIIETILSNTEFLINYPKIYNFQTFKENVENGKLLLIKTNSNIPSYATSLNDGSQRYLWRDVQRVGNINNVTLPEYPFTNGCFYVYKNLNFYLRRQDPHNYNNLYYSNFPNDVVGSIITGNDNYEYINEDENLC